MLHGGENFVTPFLQMWDNWHMVRVNFVATETCVPVTSYIGDWIDMLPSLNGQFRGQCGEC